MGCVLKVFFKSFITSKWFYTKALPVQEASSDDYSLRPQYMVYKYCESHWVVFLWDCEHARQQRRRWIEAGSRSWSPLRRTACWRGVARSRQSQCCLCFCKKNTSNVKFLWPETLSCLVFARLKLKSLLRKFSKQRSLGEWARENFR